MQSGSFTKLSETRDTAHSKEVKKLVSEVQRFYFIYIYCTQISQWPPKDLLLLNCVYETLVLPNVQKQYKQKFEKERGKSVYNHMIVPPDVQHAMDVAKSQSNVRAFLHERLSFEMLLGFYTVLSLCIVP